MERAFGSFRPVPRQIEVDEVDETGLLSIRWDIPVVHTRHDKYISSMLDEEPIEPTLPVRSIVPGDTPHEQLPNIRDQPSFIRDLYMVFGNPLQC